MNDMEAASTTVIESGSVAKKRWRILRRAVVEAAAKTTQNKEGNDDDDVSVRRFSSFELFQTQRIPKPDLLVNDSDYPPAKKQLLNEDRLTDNNDIDAWFDYRYDDGDNGITLPSIRLCLHSPKLQVRDLANYGDVDNTGNVCVWPAEEVLAFYLARRPELVCGKTVVELGGGLTCLAGLVAAKWSGAKRVVMTDGNVKSVENVERILSANDLCRNQESESSDDQGNERDFNSAASFLPPSLPPLHSARLLRWDAVEDHAADLRRAVDVVIAADCLFFDAFRQSLVDSLDFLLSDDVDAMALIFAPRRKKTLEDFVRLAEKSGFIVTIRENYDDVVSQKMAEGKKRDSFDADIHYPLLLMIHRPRLS